jgi:hypothetical protein
MAFTSGLDTFTSQDWHFRFASRLTKFFHAAAARVYFVIEGQFLYAFNGRKRGVGTAGSQISNGKGPFRYPL